MRIVVTGCNGFIGKKIFDLLTSEGYQAVGISRGLGKDIHVRMVDICNLSELEHLANELGSVDFLIHCASLSPGQTPTLNNSIFSENVLLSKNIINVFEKSTKTFIFLSSIDVYGNHCSEFSEVAEIAVNPVTDYGKSKLVSEHLFIKIPNVNCHILRLAPVYSQENLKDLSKRVLLPRTRIRVKLVPPPFHSLTKVELILEKILKIIKANEDGKFLHQIVDSKPTSQATLIELFDGPTIIFSSTVCLFLLRLFRNAIPKHFFNSLLKFFSSNLYKSGVINIDKNGDY